jgi:hypothetical protein
MNADGMLTKAQLGPIPEEKKVQLAELGDHNIKALRASQATGR